MALQSRFLASLGPVEQARIFEQCASAAASLHAWAAAYPLIRAVRIWPLSLSVAAAAPFASVEEVISTARLSLWVFTLDDIFDEEQFPRLELLERASNYRELALGRGGSPTRDDLATALSEVRADLARYPLFASLGSEWANALCGTIDGMLAEDRWRLDYRAGGDAAERLPSYAEYVATGRYSIGGPPHIWAALITTGDASTPAHLDHLRAMERLASTCVRLANDLQSNAKEAEEGNVNGLVLLNRELLAHGASPERARQQAEARVRADIADGLARLAALRAAAVTETGRPEAAIDNIARFVCDFYVHHDYHTFLGEVAA